MQTLYILCLYICIPDSVYSDIAHQNSNVSQLKKDLWEWYLKNHPFPSWKHIADALYQYGEHDVLDVLKDRYLKGEYDTMYVISYDLLLYYVDDVP